MKTKIFAFLIIIPSMSSFAGEFSANVEIGGQYDSNVTIDELDINASEGDTAAIVELFGGWEETIVKNTELLADVSLFETRYSEFDEFNLRTLLYSAAIARAQWNADLGIELRHSDSELDGTDFLSTTFINPSYSRFASDTLYFRLGAEAGNKYFDSNPDRDASVNALTSDVYFFKNKTQHYYSLGYRYQTESADDSLYDAKEHELRLQWNGKYLWLSREFSIKAGMSYERLQYDNPAVEEYIDDETQSGLYAESLVGLTSKAYFRVRLEFVKNQSDIDALDYSQYLIESVFGMEL